MLTVIDGERKIKSGQDYLKGGDMYPFVSCRKQKALKRNKQKYLNNLLKKASKLPTVYDPQPDNPIFSSYPAERMYQSSKYEERKYGGNND